MRLRNKKTGKIEDFGNLQVYAEIENTDESQLLGNFNSLKQILEYYEDYKPKEPLIKDEKIRKAVRAWAEVNEVHYVKHLYECNKECKFKDAYCDYSISFYAKNLGLENGGVYKISELCGEEE